MNMKKCTTQVIPKIASEIRILCRVAPSRLALDLCEIVSANAAVKD